MSVKKCLVLAAAGIASVGAAAALAGGPDQMVMPPAPAFQPKVYVEANAGYARVNWSRFAGTPFLAGASKERGGFTYGFDGGYQFSRNLALELGWFYLPKVKGFANGTGGFIRPGALRLKSWFIYVAGKLTVPLLDNVDAYLKMGAAYRRLTWNGAGVGSGKTTNGYWRPVFAGGFSYMVSESWEINVQYLRLPGNLRESVATKRAPAANVWTASLGYAFPV